jgi:pantoate--beta-alanine ligase
MTPTASTEPPEDRGPAIQDALLAPATVLTSPGQARSWSEEQRRQGHTVALVPTMGALHAGHLALIDLARDRADVVVVSIFVNPLQFDRQEDFDRYPRPLEVDLAVCAGHGVDAVYAPTASAMYPPGFDTHVEPGAVAEPFEGAGRPGHFAGVATVVTKLFAAVSPHVAVFGEKDAQQLAVIRRFTRDLDLGVEILAIPTAREADGLALSSRNLRLSRQDRAAAICLPRALQAAQAMVYAGERSARSIEAAASAQITAEPLARIEYLALVDPSNFGRIADLEDSGLLILAVWFGEIRLIDNQLLTC